MVVQDLVDVGGLVVPAATSTFCFQASNSLSDAYCSKSVRRDWSVDFWNMCRSAACPLRLYCSCISSGMGVSSCCELLLLLLLVVVVVDFLILGVGRIFVVVFVSTGVKPTP